MAALAESLSSGYETHSGVSLANQQTVRPAPLLVPYA
jgi:hypothetical protein